MSGPDTPDAIDEVAARAIASAVPATNGAAAKAIIERHDELISQVYDFAIQEIEQAEERLAALKTRIEAERKLTSEKGRHFISMVEGALTSVQAAHTFIESLEAGLKGETP